MASASTISIHPIDGAIAFLRVRHLGGDCYVFQTHLIQPNGLSHPYTEVSIHGDQDRMTFLAPWYDVELGGDQSRWLDKGGHVVTGRPRDCPYI